MGTYYTKWGKLEHYGMTFGSWFWKLGHVQTIGLFGKEDGLVSVVA